MSPPELEAIYMPWLESHYVKIPEILHKYDVFTFDGNFQGKIEDFAIKARTTTPGMVGSVLFNCVMDNIGDIRYDGWFGLGQVQFGFLTGQSFWEEGRFPRSSMVYWAIRFLDSIYQAIYAVCSYLIGKFGIFV